MRRIPVGVVCLLKKIVDLLSPVKIITFRDNHARLTAGWGMHAKLPAMWRASGGLSVSYLITLLSVCALLCVMNTRPTNMREQSYQITTPRACPHSREFCIPHATLAQGAACKSFLVSGLDR